MRLNWKTIGKVAISILGFFIKKNNPNLGNEIDKVQEVANAGIDEIK